MLQARQLTIKLKGGTVGLLWALNRMASRPLFLWLIRLATLIVKLAQLFWRRLVIPLPIYIIVRRVVLLKWRNSWGAVRIGGIWNCPWQL